MSDFSIKNTGNDDLQKPIPFDDGLEVPEILDLGADAESGKAPEKKTSEKITSSPERISGVKTFFVKLHSGSMGYIDEQINSWLKDNPSVVIKRTNITTGQVMGKTTEPNLIVTVWF